MAFKKQSFIFLLGLLFAVQSSYSASPIIALIPGSDRSEPSSLEIPLERWRSDPKLSDFFGNPFASLGLIYIPHQLDAHFSMHYLVKKSEASETVKKLFGKEVKTKQYLEKNLVALSILCGSNTGSGPDYDPEESTAYGPAVFIKYKNVSGRIGSFETGTLDVTDQDIRWLLSLPETGYIPAYPPSDGFWGWCNLL